MTEPVTPCPSPEEILRWVAGHFEGTPRGVEINLHVAECPDLCGEYVRASSVIIQAVLQSKGVSASTTAVAAERKTLPELIHQAKAREQDAERIFAGEPATWWEQLTQHPEHHDPDFLWYVADKAVYYADEKPAEMRGFVAAMTKMMKGLPRESRARTVNAQLALAEGVALRTQGDHVGALQCYAHAERELPDSGLQPEHPFINLARAASLRRLNQLDEARRVLDLSRRGFAALGMRGESKALWQLANLAYEAGDPRTAFRMAHQAHRLRVTEGNEAEAAILRQVLAVSLLALKRPRPARRILDELQINTHIARNPYEQARLLWNRAHLLSVEGDATGAATLLERAAHDFGAAGAALDAARAELDLAHLAGRQNDIARQGAAATRAAAILGALPGQAANYLSALAELRQAIQAGAAVAGAVAKLREQLRRL